MNDRSDLKSHGEKAQNTGRTKRKIQGVNKKWSQTILYNPRCRSHYHHTGKIVPIAPPERENHSRITSTVRLEFLSRSMPVYDFSWNGWSTIRESSFGLSARSMSRLKTFTHVSRHSSETLLTSSTASGASGGGASMFGKEVKTCR
jgi:hypothetical protein